MRGGSATPQPQGTHAEGGTRVCSAPLPHHGTRREPRGCGAPLQFPPVASKFPNLSVLFWFFFSRFGFFVFIFVSHAGFVFYFCGVFLLFSQFWGECLLFWVSVCFFFVVVFLLFRARAQLSVGHFTKVRILFFNVIKRRKKKKKEKKKREEGCSKENNNK